MQITLYNTCPIEYEKKLKKIHREIVNPAIKAGKEVSIVEMDEEISHKRECHQINDTRFSHNYSRRKKAACRTCPYERNGRSLSDTTMKIKIS